MADLPTPRDIEIMAIHAGISVAQACRNADVSPAVFTRWKRGKGTPTLESLGKIMVALRAAKPDAEAV